jgi:hypothetical protein
MKNSRYAFNHIFLGAFLVIGAVAVSAMFLKYSGDVQIKFGVDGIQLHLTGKDSMPHNSN